MDNNKKETEADLKTIDLLHELVRRRFTTSLDTIDKLDQKLVTLISVDAIIISILFPTALFNNKACFYVAVGFIVLSLSFSEFADILLKVFMVRIRRQHGMVIMIISIEKLLNKLLLILYMRTIKIIIL